MKINWVDIIIVIYIVRAFFLGKKRGLGVELIALISALFAWVLSTNYYQLIAQSFSRWFLLTEKTARTVAFVLIAVFILFIGAILARVLKKVMKLSFIPNVEKIGGCVFGIARGISLCAIIIVALSLCPITGIQQEVYVKSFLGNYLVALTPKVNEWVLRNKSGSQSSFDISKFWADLPERPKGEVL